MPPPPPPPNPSLVHLPPWIETLALLHVLPLILLVTPAQLTRPGIGRNTSCALSDWLTSSPGGCSQRELWFTDILMYLLHSMALSPCTREDLATLATNNLTDYDAESEIQTTIIIFLFCPHKNYDPVSSHTGLLHSYPHIQSCGYAVLLITCRCQGIRIVVPQSQSEAQETAGVSCTCTCSSQWVCFDCGSRHQLIGN